MGERWQGNLFQMFEATDEKDLDRSDRVGTYLWTRTPR